MDEFVETVGAIPVGGVAGVVVAGLVGPEAALGMGVDAGLEPRGRGEAGVFKPVAEGVVHGRRCVIVSKEARRRVLLVRTGAVFANTPVRL
jgi:hypothetical protein